MKALYLIPGGARFVGTNLATRLGEWLSAERAERPAARAAEGGR